MIVYIVISYTFMLCVFISDSVKVGELTGFKMFLIAPVWFPLIVLGLFVKLIDWSAK